MPKAVQIARRGHTLEITIDHPPANAINREVGQAIHQAMILLRDDDDLRVGIVTGGGERFFSAGWDLKELARSEDGAASAADAITMPGGFAGMTECWDLYKPIIAAVNGHAVGGGFEIALACDIVLAADRAEFFLPEMQRGFLPDAGAVQRLPRKPSTGVWLIRSCRRTS